MANKLGPPNSSILSSLLFLTLVTFYLSIASFYLLQSHLFFLTLDIIIHPQFQIIRTSLAARNLNDNVLEWVKKDHHRFLRAVIYVSNLDRSVRYAIYVCFLTYSYNLIYYHNLY